MELLFQNLRIEQDVTLAIVAAILGIAFPIIMQVIGQIDTKYGSTRLVQRIKRSWQFRFFVIMLGIAILARIYYCFAPPRSADWGSCNYFVDKSAISLVFVAVGTLIVSLFFFVFKILAYYNPQRLLEDITKSIKTIRKQHQTQQPQQSNKSFQRQKETLEERQFKDWNDLAVFIVSNKNEDTVLTLYQSLYEVSSVIAKGQNNEVIFPTYFYNLLRSINQLICQQKQELISVLNSSITTNIFFTSFAHTRINSDSYYCIWLCLSEQLFGNREDLVFQYWTWAYQHYTLVLSHRLREGEITNRGMKGLEHTVSAEDVKNRENDRFEFLLFNTALGGLLLYKERYGLLHDMFHFKQSTFEFSASLIPDSYSSIIELYLSINRTNYADPVWLERRYPFIDLRGGISTNDIIKYWIEKYLAILMIRAEYVQRVSGRSFHTEFSRIPDTIADKSGWAERLERFADIIGQVIETIDIHKIDPRLSKTPEAIGALRAYVEELRQAIDRQEIEQRPDPELIREFCDTAKEAANGFVKVLKAICDKKTGKTPQPYTCQLRFSYTEAQDKSLYCTGQAYSRNNFSEAVDALVRYNLDARLGHKLLAHSKASAVCLRDDLLHVLDKLNLKDDHIAILSSPDYGHWFDDMEKDLQKVTGDFEYRYKDTPLFKLNLRSRGTCIWILRTDELPGYSFGEVANSTYADAMQPLGDGVFADVIDLYRNPEINERYQRDNPGNYDKSVLELFDVVINLHYGDNARILRIILTDQWSNIPHTAWQEVKPFDEYF